MEVPSGEVIQVINVALLAPVDDVAGPIVVTLDGRLGAVGRLVVEVQLARGARVDWFEAFLWASIGSHDPRREAGNRPKTAAKRTHVVRGFSAPTH